MRDLNVRSKTIKLLEENISTTLFGIKYTNIALDLSPKARKRAKIVSQSVSQFSHIRLFATPWIAARQASLSITNSRSLLKLMSMLSYFKFWKMMLWKCCTQYASKFGKLSSGHRTGKGQFSFQSQRKAKTNKWDLITINIVCSAKETINKMKRQPKEWEKTFANDMTDKWFNVQNKQLINSISRNKQPD